MPFEIGCYVVPGDARRLSAETPGIEVLAAGGTSALVAAVDRTALEATGLDIRPVGGYAAPLRVDG